MVVLADFPVVKCYGLDIHAILHTRSRGQVLHHPGQVVTVGVTVANEEEVLVVPGLTLGREGQSRGLDLAGRTVPSGGIALV